MGWTREKPPTYAAILGDDHPALGNIIEGINIIEAAAKSLNNTELEEAITVSIRAERQEADPVRRLGTHLVSVVLSQEQSRRRLH